MKRTAGQHQADHQYAAPAAFSAWRTATPPLQDLGDRAPEPGEIEDAQEAMPFPGPYAYFPVLPPPQDAIATAALPVEAGPHATGVKRTDFDSLLLSIKTKDHEALADLLKQGEIDINAFDPATGLSPLALAACNGDQQAVAMLLDHGANANLPDEHHAWTALMHAARHGHTGIIEILAAHGGTALDAANSEGRTAMHLAAQYGQPGAIARLLSSGALPSVVDNNGISPLMVAAHHGDVAATGLLLACGTIDLDKAVMKDGRTALHIAAFSDKPEVAACLLAAGANPNSLDAFGEPPLISAVAENSVGVARLLAATPGIQLDIVAINGRTALQAAVSDDRPELARILLAAGARCDRCSDPAQLPISMALARRSAAMVEALLDHGATLQKFTAPGDDTPFTVAVADLQNMHAAHDIPPLIFPAQDMVLPVATPPVLASVLAVMDDQSDLFHCLRSQRILMPCAKRMAECLASCSKAVKALEEGRKPLGANQKLWLCTSALSLMPPHTIQDTDLQVYRQAGIGEAGLARLAGAAQRQFGQVSTMVEQVMTSLGASLLESMVPNCLALTSRSYGIDALALEMRQTDAGFLPPLAHAIAHSWQLALAGIAQMDVKVPALSTHQQLTQALKDLAERAAPALFAQALSASLSSHALVEGLRHLIGDMKNAELIDVLFQIQCDQLRQYCRQMTSAD